MTEQEARDPHEEAQKKVAAVLADYERETGRIVRHVEICDIDASGFTERKLLRRILIHADAVPGTSWHT